MTTHRTCDGCTKCCEGWLSGSAHGRDFYAGKPCHFLGKGCSIYKDRPKDPCKTYKCEWLGSDQLPMWMRPDLCGVIATHKCQDGVEFYSLVEAGKDMDAAVLSWFFQWAINNNHNLYYQIKGGSNRIGSPAFMALTL